MECEDTEWYDPSHSSCSGGIPGLFIELAAVTFGGNNHPVARDSDGTDYEVPHWLSWKDEACIEDAFCCFNWWDELCGEDVYDGHEHPVAYTRNDTVEIEEVRFLISGNLEDPQLMVLVPGSEGVVIPLSPDGHYLVATNFDLLELGDTIAHYDPLEIEWRVFITIDDENHDVHIATSENTLYVTLADPQTSPLYHTVVDIACRRAHGLDDNHANHPQHIIDAIWEEFKTLNITRAEPGLPLVPGGAPHEVKLHYYLNWNAPTGVDEFLREGDSRCDEWAGFFMRTLLVHGTISDVVGISACVPEGMPYLLPKKWGFNDPGTHPQSNFPYLNQCVGVDDPVDALTNSYNWNPLPPDVQNEGSTAQGHDNALALFEAHTIVHVNGKFYDPSYGLGPYTNLQTTYSNDALDAHAYLKSFPTPGPTGVFLRLRRAAAPGGALKVVINGVTIESCPEIEP